MLPDVMSQRQAATAIAMEHIGGEAASMDPETLLAELKKREGVFVHALAVSQLPSFLRSSLSNATVQAGATFELSITRRVSRMGACGGLPPLQLGSDFFTATVFGPSIVLCERFSQAELDRLRAHVGPGARGQGGGGRIRG